MLAEPNKEDGCRWRTGIHVYTYGTIFKTLFPFAPSSLSQILRPIC